MKEQLRDYIQDELLDGRQIAEDENLLVSGLIDSMGIMRLISFIDAEWQLAVPPEDVTIENFMTIEQIIRYLGERSQP